MTELRLGLLIAGILLLLGIWLFSRRPRRKPDHAARRTPSLNADAIGLADAAEQAEPALPGDPPTRPLGMRPDQDFDKIVTLYVAAKPNRTLRGTDIVVAAEKVGLTYGHLDIFHRLPLSAPERGPIFSMANLQAPNSFPMHDIQTLETTALVFFLTLPAPVSALDALEAMLPAAQRIAELLDAIVLDEHRSALTRQRTAELRDELRAWDRQQAENMER